MKKNLFLCLIITLFSSCTHKMTYDSKQLLSSVDFISHAQEKAPYLAQNISFNEIKKIKDKLENHIGKKLKNRGEAHITVITPPEYDILKEKISMTTIDELASISKIQELPFEILCLGKGQSLDKKNETYFIIVKSPSLLELRKKIKSTFVKFGGNNEKFDAELFYPHITVGFIDRDMYLQDGVIKDVSNCYLQMTADRSLLQK